MTAGSSGNGEWVRVTSVFADGAKYYDEDTAYLPLSCEPLHPTRRLLDHSHGRIHRRALEGGARL